MRPRLETRLALDLLQIAHDLDRPEAAVPAESPDGRDLAGPGPTSDGLRVDPEHLGHLGRRQKGIGVGTVLHRRSSLYGVLARSVSHEGEPVSASSPRY